MDATEAYIRLRYLRLRFIFKITLKIFIFKIELKDDIDFCDEIDVTFPMGCVQYQSELFTLLFSILKVIFILLSGFAGRDIKDLCIWSRHRKYLSPFFCCIGPCYDDSCIYYTNIFFLHFNFFKKGVHKKCNGIFGMNVNFPYYMGLQDEAGSFISSEMDGLTFKPTMMAPSGVIQLESSIN